MKVILVGGGEHYLVQEKLSQLRSQFNKKKLGGEVFSVFADELDSINQVPVLNDSLGMFSTEAFVMVWNVLSEGSASIRQAFFDLLDSERIENLPGVLVLAEQRNLDHKTKLYKLLKQKFEVSEHREVDSFYKRKFIDEKLKKLNWHVENTIKTRLFELLDRQDLSTISNEFSKLELLLQQEKKQVLELEHLNLINPIIEEEVWELFSLSHKDKPAAFKLLDNLLQQQIRPEQIIGFLAMELERLTQFYYFPHQLNSYIQSRIAIGARDFQIPKLKLALQKLFSLDKKLKTSNLEPRLGLILYLSIL